MPSERAQRQIDRLLDEAEQAIGEGDWQMAQRLTRRVLTIDPDNEDGRVLLAAAERGLAEEGAGATERLHPADAPSAGAGEPPALPADATPTSFDDGRYTVKRFLGEGGKKKVYLAHDKSLDRDVAFALIKTEGLDDIGRERVSREGQAMGRLGSHPHIVTVFDLGEEAGQPFMVTELMGGGDVEGLIEKAADHRLPLEQALRIADEVCQGLEFAHSQNIVHRDLKPGNVWLTEAIGSRQSAVGGGARPVAHDPRLASPQPSPTRRESDEVGVAKIGDFGLAVAIDRTRLTQAGMMVGTVSYMPPEQATGGAVTPRSDLYSLGAMLYEMVTGRPPFVGDEAVAIIGQHLNVAPVSPTWHRPDCPPGLEALILRLLEKDPSKRPESAAIVREALGRIAAAVAHPSSPALLPQGEKGDGGAGPVPYPLSAVPSDNPTYRRAFVGREAELRQLQAAYDGAASGQGGLVMVVGEPGIGKTALCEQLATYAIVRGGKALAGHCYEEGSLSLPYLPFVEAMRSYVLAREPEALKRDLGSGAGDVARIVSEIRDRLPDLREGRGSPSPLEGEGRVRGDARDEPYPQTSPSNPRHTADPESERYRLFQAVSGFLRKAGSVQPLVIVLEDLHDADRGTLDLLVHLGHNLEGARLLIVGTYRDVEVDRTHALSSALADLRRSASFSRITLRGLSIDEVHRMMTAIRGQEVAWSGAETIHRQTEGNPLFVQEVLRYLVEEGLVVREGGRYEAPDGGVRESGIPEGLRDVIGKRLSRLSDKTNQVLSIASVVGRDFRLDVLAQVAVATEEDLTSALEEATATAIVEERRGAGMGIAFRFTHALFRQTLYEEIFSLRRVRLHQQVGRALEAVYARRLEEHAAELAEHFAQSTEQEDVEKALRYSELAAQRSTQVYAYGEAVRHLERALQIQEVLDPDDRARRCDLLLALGNALRPAGEYLRMAREVAPEALRLAEALGDETRAARACLVALDGLRFYGPGSMTATPEGRQWIERADRYAAAGMPERVETDIQRSTVLRMDGRLREAHALVLDSLELAQTLGNQPAMYSAAQKAVLQDWLPEDQQDRLRVAREAGDWPRQGAGDRLAPFLLYGGQACLAWGDRIAAEKLWRELSELAERSSDPNVARSRSAAETFMATVDGRLEVALSLSEQRATRAAELGHPGASKTAVIFSLRPLLFLGRAAEALTVWEQGFGVPPEPGESAIAAVCLAHLGRRQEANEAIRRGMAELGFPDRDDGLRMDSLGLLLEAAALAADRDSLPALMEQTLRLGSVAFVEGSCLTCIPRQLGAASALLGDREQAMAYYEQALEVCTKIRFRPELALTHLGIAELLLGGPHPSPLPEVEGESHRAPTDDSGSVGARHASPWTPSATQRTEAMQHLDIAIAELREMKMQPALERALRHKDMLKA